jgi:hypothetical protein
MVWQIKNISPKYKFAIGSLVKHVQFGLGQVTAVEWDGWVVIEGISIVGPIRKSFGDWYWNLDILKE